MSRQDLIAARTQLRSLLRAEPEVRVAGINLTEDDQGHLGLEIRVYGVAGEFPEHVIPTDVDGFPVMTLFVDPPPQDGPVSIQAQDRR